MAKQAWGTPGKPGSAVAAAHAKHGPYSVRPRPGSGGKTEVYVAEWRADQHRDEPGLILARCTMAVAGAVVAACAESASTGTIIRGIRDGHITHEVRGTWAEADPVEIATY